MTVQLNQTVNQDLTVGQNGAVGGVLSRSDGSPSADTQVELFTVDGYAAGDARTDAHGHWQIDKPAGQYYACYVAYDTTMSGPATRRPATTAASRPVIRSPLPRACSPR